MQGSDRQLHWPFSAFPLLRSSLNSLPLHIPSLHPSQFRSLVYRLISNKSRLIFLEGVPSLTACPLEWLVRISSHCLHVFVISVSLCILVSTFFPFFPNWHVLWLYNLAGINLLLLSQPVITLIQFIRFWSHPFLLYHSPVRSVSLLVPACSFLPFISVLAVKKVPDRTSLKEQTLSFHRPLQYKRESALGGRKSCSTKAHDVDDHSHPANGGTRLVCLERWLFRWLGPQTHGEVT